MSASRISCLDTHVIDHIAAGEVVERPAAVVKELLENAYDAGAHHVQIQLERGGLQRITVTDDGCGMSVEDAQRCILRHATSKIKTIEDLASVQTLGFRGEALSSIAAVSKMILTTRPQDAVQGFELTVHAGEIVSRRTVGCPVGTAMDIQDLFYNTPARQKFMRAPATEQAHVVEAVQRVVLGRFEGECVVSTQHRRLIDVPAPKDQQIDEKLLQKRIGYLLGDKIGKLTFVASENEIGNVQGFVSEPQLSRTETKGMWIFVNGRFVRDRMLQRAVLDTYKIHQPNRYPTVILWLDVDPNTIDVNVHPQKLEVRFSNAHLVYQLISAAVAQSIASSVGTNVPMYRSQIVDRWDGNSQVAESKREVCATRTVATESESKQTQMLLHDAENLAFTLPVSQKIHNYRDVGVQKQAAFNTQTPWVAQTEEFSTQSQNAEHSSHIRLLGRLGARFLLGENEEGIWVLDWKKLAHLKVTQHIMQQMQEDERLEKKQLLLPPILHLEADETQLLETYTELLNVLGFELDPIGPQQFCLRSIPAALDEADPITVVRVFLKNCLHLQQQNKTPQVDAILPGVLRAWEDCLPVAPLDHVICARMLSKMLYSLRTSENPGLVGAMHRLTEFDASRLIGSKDV